MSATDTADRLEIVERITHLFRAERFAYLAVTLMAFGLLMASAWVTLFQSPPGEGRMIEAGAMFGASGLIGATTGRILTMWNKVLALVMAPAPPEGDE